jgi:hypothetical protein
MEDFMRQKAEKDHQELEECMKKKAEEDHCHTSRRITKAR